MTYRRSARRLTALTAATLLLLAGCGDDDESNDTVAPPAEPAATAAATPAETPAGMPSETPSAAATASESPTAAAEEGTVITVNLVDGKPEPALSLNQRLSKGDTVTIAVTTDKAYEVHVHGYNYSIKAVPGETVKKTFVVDKSGTWEVEVEETGKLLFNLVVS